ncbi:hypothetical protein FRC01_005831 [Tulasnella sp. 417]|nr:hypothetical protein FRC01_005831 [Tulasnella sp. 417]
MLDELRKLRSGREYNPYALGHPTKALDLRSVLEALPRYPVTPGSPACPTALISEERLPTESSAEIIPKIPSVQLNSYAGGENTNASNDQSEPEGNRKSTKERSALQLKRARERARKKEKLDPARGREASRRVDFILKSLETAHGDFLLERAIHSQQGYVGVPDGGEDWRNFSNSKAARLRYLRDVGGYLLVDTSLDPRVDYPFIDANGHVWAVALAEPPGWEDRRAGIASARLHLSNRVAHLNVPFNRRGDFRSYQFGFSFGMGRTIPMNFKNSALVHEALVTFFDDPNVQSLFRFAEGLFSGVYVRGFLITGTNSMRAFKRRRADIRSSESRSRELRFRRLPSMLATGLSAIPTVMQATKQPGYALTMLTVLLMLTKEAI